MKTPWGKSDHQEELAKGIVFYSTPSHGGFKISADRLKEMPEEYRNQDGWYEEDCEALKVMASWPDLFKDVNQEDIKKQIKFWESKKEEYSK